jgi:hypothetical protein
MFFYLLFFLFIILCNVVNSLVFVIFGLLIDITIYLLLFTNAPLQGRWTHNSQIHFEKKIKHVFSYIIESNMCFFVSKKRAHTYTWLEARDTGFSYLLSFFSSSFAMLLIVSFLSSLATSLSIYSTSSSM